MTHTHRDHIEACKHAMRLFDAQLLARKKVSGHIPADGLQNVFRLLKWPVLDQYFETSGQGPSGNSMLSTWVFVESHKRSLRCQPKFPALLCIEVPLVAVRPLILPDLFWI